MSNRQKPKKKNLPSRPTKTANETHSTRGVQVHGEIHSGPLPAPQVLLQYNQIVPSAADRIIVMAEQQASHRQKLEQIVVKSGARDSLLGLIFGLIIGLATETGAVLCILNGHQGGGATLGISGLVGLVGVFVYGSRQRRQEREMKMGLQQKG